MCVRQKRKRLRVSRDAQKARARDLICANHEIGCSREETVRKITMSSCGCWKKKERGRISLPFWCVCVSLFSLLFSSLTLSSPSPSLSSLLKYSSEKTVQFDVDTISSSPWSPAPCGCSSFETAECDEECSTVVCLPSTSSPSPYSFRHFLDNSGSLLSGKNTKICTLCTVQ